MRNQERYDRAMERVRWYLDFHKAPVWLVPVEDGYLVAINDPDPCLLPKGTRAVKYGPGMVELASVEARK